MKSQSQSTEDQAFTNEEIKEDSAHDEDSGEDEEVLEENFKIIKRLIENDKIEELQTILQSTDSKSFIKLINYSSQGKLTIIKYLIDNDKTAILAIILQEAQTHGKFAEILNVYDPKKFTPLQYAIKSDNLQALKTILKIADSENFDKVMSYSEYQKNIDEDSTYEESSEGKLTPIDFAKKYEKDAAIEIIEEAILDQTQDDYQYFDKYTTEKILYIDTDISKALTSDAKETSAIEILPSLERPDQLEQFSAGLTWGALANPAIRYLFNNKNEFNLECFSKGLERSISNSILLKNLNLESIIGSGFKYSITTKISIDYYYDKAAFNMQYAKELAQYAIVSFASIAIPAALLSYKIVPNSFALGFIVNTLPIALEPAVDKIFEGTYSLGEYASNGICSLTGYCSTNAGAEEDFA